jgi:DNA-binding transcriptional LysR family regulator
MRKLPSFFALRAFEAAARLNSFTLAGRELHLTPSAISHQVRALEEYFGKPLFERRNRRIDLTPDGTRLLSGLTGAFDAIEAICAELEPSPRRNSLVVHCAPSFAAKWLGPRLPDFMRRHPQISLQLLSGAGQVDLMRRDELDIAIVYGGVTPSLGTVIEPLGDEDVTALCRPDLAANFDPADRFPLTLIESSVSPVRWSDWFQLNNLAMPVQQAHPSFDRGALAISAACQGLGVALESRRFALDELARGELVELGQGRLKAIRRPMHFLCYRDGHKSAGPITAFRNWLLECVERA